jgi:predicted ferric reductase
MSDFSPADREIAFRRASDRVQARLGFFAHAAIFLLLGVLLLALNLITTEGALWFFWPLVFWLPALVAHAGLVYGIGFLRIERWRDREYLRELEHMRSVDDHADDVRRESQ